MNDFLGTRSCILFDTHCHLNDEAFENDWREVINRAYKGGVHEMMVVGYDLPSSRKAVEIAEECAGIRAAVGVHPHDAKTVTSSSIKEVENLLSKKKVKALGEIGLDFHYDNSPRELQKQVFRTFLELAKAKDKPVIIHDREAHGEILTILKEVAALAGGKLKGVMHCYSGSPEMLPELLEMGFFISIAGPVTFKNAKRLPEVVKLVPEERLLIETDSPYLAPHPYRGKRNEPSYLPEVAKKIADIKGINLIEIANITRNNARQLFGIN